MKKNWLVFLIIIITTALCVAAASVAIILWGNADTFSDKFGIMLSVVSMVVSVVALIYAMITYYSIDKVQAISSVEGNVLYNKKYTVAYPESIAFFEDCSTSEDFCEKLFDLLLYNKTKNCREYAHRLQLVVDNLIWIAYAEHDDIFYKKCNILIEKLESEKIRYSFINSGLSDIIEENMKMIKGVIDYQNHKIQNSFVNSKLENIRGQLLENPVAAITYYDYLGLEYMRRARGLLNDNDIFTASKMNNIITLFNTAETEHIKENYLFMLEFSHDALEKAEVLSANDIIWKGYISYNLARVRIMKYLLKPTAQEKTNILEYINSVIKNRKKVLFTIWPDRQSNDKISLLHKRFIKELTSAQQLYIEFSNTGSLEEII